MGGAGVRHAGVGVAYGAQKEKEGETALLNEWP